LDVEPGTEVDSCDNISGAGLTLSECSGIVKRCAVRTLLGLAEDELKEHLVDLYKELTSGTIPNVRKMAELDIV
jgi:hypothetical protein